eukprot:SAG31_NODE_5167_length_2703_cov_3.435100_3_plen_240_part_00
MLTLRKTEFGLGAGAVKAFDPIFTPKECQVLRHCGCTTLAINEHAARPAAVPTLFYMPHCPFVLYNNLVAANWSAPWNVVLLGNDLRFHALHNHPFVTVAPQLSKAMQIMSHIRLPDTYHPPTSRPHRERPPAPINGNLTSSAESSSYDTSIFGLGSLYTFPSQAEFEQARASKAESSSNADDWRGLAAWLQRGPGPLPTATNLHNRLAAELRMVESRAKFLRQQLAQQKPIPLQRGRL